ncbi:DUF4180 domain-containing protein [Chryseosolibacter indicus]|uniref:DUF4180 domain-containing protein n=1 Tax=Chryseosolibacter indicus TaxID=2782351 RepID=A0ABS5VWN9_9BACT|nr:DUF4180 domain-containing protein [Chryseosolibacter indicus]MBT1704416.1 DUF4180 domain-containing protein [Chryseosolibacter indicus]
MTTQHQIHELNGVAIVEIADKTLVIRDAQQFLDVVFNLPSDTIVLYKENFDEGFFNLRTGIAGEILQKAATYRRRLAIVGDFTIYESKSLRDFIYESNKGNSIVFVNTPEEALRRFSSVFL